jgi:hypothetical protein
MPAERSTRRTTDERAPGRDDRAPPEPGTTRQPTPERRFVDIDPWAVLLEQLMEVPEEGSAAREPERGGANDQPGPRRSAKKAGGK